MISIVIPLYNKAGYIRETVESVRAQTLAGWELLVVDNGSTDGGPEIVRGFNDGRIRLLSCASRGASAARNAGEREASGEWIVFLDADDILAPEYLHTQLAVSDGADMVICPYVEFVDGAPEQRTVKHPWQGTPSPVALANTAIVFAPGPTHSFLIRRGFLRNDLQWPEHLDRLLGEDAVYWFRLVNEARLAFNHQPVALYRFWTPDSRFTTLSKPSNLFLGLHAAIEENLRYLVGRGQSPSPGQAEQLMRFYAGVFAAARRLKDGDTARKSLQQARRWQQQYFRTVSRPSLPMRVRRWLGLPLFNRVFQHP